MDVGSKVVTGENARRLGYVASDSHVHGTRPRIEADGPGRGLRVLEMYAGSLAIEVLLDRAGDIGRAEWQGVAFSWTSPVGYVPASRGHGPGAALGFLRTFPGGLLATSGLEHVFSAETEHPTHSANPHVAEREYPLHGSLSSVAATLSGHGVENGPHGPIVWCDLTARQSTIFEENLLLRRRIELDSSAHTIRVSDQVVNDAPLATEVMLDYHANFGWPLLAEGSRVSPGRTPDAAPLLVCPAPLENAAERVTWTRLDSVEADRSQGGAPGARDGITLWHPSGHWGVRQCAGGDLVRYRVLWEDFQRGRYALGLEYASNSPAGRAAARRLGELTLLAPGASATAWIEWGVIGD